MHVDQTDVQRGYIQAVGDRDRYGDAGRDLIIYRELEAQRHDRVEQHHLQDRRKGVLTLRYLDQRAGLGDRHPDAVPVGRVQPGWHGLRAKQAGEGGKVEVLRNERNIRSLVARDADRRDRARRLGRALGRQRGVPEDQVFRQVGRRRGLIEAHLVHCDYVGGRGRLPAFDALVDRQLALDFGDATGGIRGAGRIAGYVERHELTLPLAAKGQAGLRADEIDVEALALNLVQALPVL